MKVQITPEIETAFKNLLKGPVDYFWATKKAAIPEYRVEKLIATDVFSFAAGYQAGANAPQLPQREPMTDEQILTAYDYHPETEDDMIEFAHAIEAHHGITALKEAK